MEDVITVTAESPLLDERRISTAATVSQTALEKMPTERDYDCYLPVQATPGVVPDRINVGGNESGQQSRYVGQIPEAEAKSLCAEIARTGWAGITLKRVLAVAPSLGEALQKAADAGLLRGFLAVVLQDKGCSEPPADVKAEARRYIGKFGAFKHP
jgi:hypothetical protein